MRLHLDMTPRWTCPDPRVDALRGCVAIERGPLVYCFEQADQPARLDELAVLAGSAPLTEHAATCPASAPPSRSPRRQAHASRAGGGPGHRPRPAPPGPDDRAVTVTAIPYFQWDNRGPGAMRVWIPAASPASPASPV